MLTIVLWLWHDDQCRTQYTPEHVSTAARMIDRHLTMPHRIVLLTDQPDAEYDPLIEPIKLWDDWRSVQNDYWRAEFPQCYVRLKAFSHEMREILGPRFVSIDIDCVVVGSLDEILSRTEDFLICRRARVTKADFYDPYQASMWMMDVGCRAKVWEKFQGERSLQKLAGKKHEKLYKKTDQGWILYTLGPNEAGWTMGSGVYHWAWLDENELTNDLPSNARIVFFNGAVKPWTMDEPPSWVTENYL